jgi:potassium efflux system protein
MRPLTLLYLLDRGICGHLSSLDGVKRKSSTSAFVGSMEIVLRQPHRLLDSPLSRLVIALVATFFFLSAVPSEAAEPKALEPQKAPAPVSSPVIPVADVAMRAMEVSNLLRTFNTRLAPSREIEKIRKQLPGVSRNIDLQLAETQKILEEQPALETLQTQEQLWQGMQHRTAGWLNGLTIRASQVQDALDQLADLQKTWTRTRDGARASMAPGPILQQIDATLAALEAAQPFLNAQRTSVLDLQSQVAGEVARCGNALGEIAQSQHTAVGGIFTRERPPIWSAHFWDHLKTTLPTRAREVGASFRTAFRQYVRDPSRGLPLQAVIFVGLALLLGAARRQVDQWASSGKGISSAIMVFERPYAAALTGSLLLAAGPISPAPPMVRNMLAVLALFPMIRLIRPIVPPPMIVLLYTLGTLFALDTVRQAFAGAPLVGESILVLEAFGGIAVLGRFLHRGRLQRSPAAEGETSRTRALEAGAVFLLVLLAAGLAAAALGYLRLARFVAPGILAGGVEALTVFALFQVAKGAVAFVLRVWPLRLLQMVQHHRAPLERRFCRWLAWLAILFWAVRYLDYIGLLDPAFSLGGAILATKLERGSISISVGDILAFFLAVWAAYLLSAFIRFVLQEDVYPRIGVPRGLSYATSSLLNYIILALGFAVGIGVLGVDPTKVTVLVGAFGVGIGFGLQNVVNNFVSGLILLFERPIHVGDTIEVGDLLGKVGRIGIRASTVRTWTGADIIVPNSQLISDRVTNWTLSDQLRRIDLPVGVNYSAPPQEVIKVLEAVAGAHPRILKNPPPQALFVGYGDSSINFELRAWTDQFDNWPRIRSDLAVALYDAVHEAGMAFPFPQREVRLLPDPGARSKS